MKDSTPVYPTGDKALQTPRRRRRLLPWFASVVLVLVAAGLQGAPAEPEEESGPQPVDSESAEPESADQEASAREVFLPTEEISEDYAAPFPVDI